jgi:glycosyltransferase involved in cell wall biosynthesis
MGIRKDVPAFLSMADFFLLITIMEGLPLSILEAAAAGLPVIASDAGGIPEAVIDGETGYLAKPGDLGELTSAIEKMAALSEGARAALGAAGKEFVSRQYDLEVITRKYLEVYAGAIRTARHA